MIQEGDWVLLVGTPDLPVFGRVRDIYGTDDRRLNLYVYDCSGSVVGRYTEPDLGDPQAYEPNLPADQFVKILEPVFPIPRDSWENHLLRTPMFP